MKSRYKNMVVALIITGISSTNISYAENGMDSVFKRLNNFMGTTHFDLVNTQKTNPVLDLAISSIIVRYALEELDKPYVYGSTGPQSYDCSGLTYSVFAKADISIPRVSSDQGISGESVERDRLMPGDLIFFDTRNSNDETDISVDTSDIISLFPSDEPVGVAEFVPRKVTHVGIYVAEGKFIHASSGNEMKVVIADLSNKYYNQRYLFAKRYI
ncbi:C40 family peptidase [Proteocatella sphenisci]|uniref:C40 family peptidase n=1 Tax=Proteocatella sphenisci TaxID=181070 RepID=UPI0004B26B6A|nr:C40 family peptidase [Proteocatella sphenisci]